MNATINEKIDFQKAKEILDKVSKLNNLYGSCALGCLKINTNEFVIGYVLELYDDLIHGGMRSFDAELIKDITIFGEKNKRSNSKITGN